MGVTAVLQYLIKAFIVAADFMTTNVFSAVRCSCRVCTVTVSESEAPVVVPETAE